MAQRESIDRKKIEMRAATINRALRGVQRQLARNGCGNAYLPEDSAPKSPPDHIIRHPAEEGNLAVEVGAEIIRAVLEEPFEALGIF